MKPIRIVISPTRSRPVNIFLGILLLLVSLLVLLSLATWHASDPSLNTAASQAQPRNWIGLFGSYLSDLLLQSLGITAFLPPLWLAGIGWSWMRSRSGGSAWLRALGAVLTLAFLPAVLGLAPWHWRWMHLLPVEGVAGRLMAGLLVTYLNIQGAWLVAAVLAAAGLYIASAVSFSALIESIENRWLQLVNLHDRWQDRRAQRADLRDELDFQLEAARDDLPPAQSANFISGLGPDAASGQSSRRPGFLARLFRRRAREDNSLDDIPAFRRAPLESAWHEDFARPDDANLDEADQANLDHASTAPAPPIPIAPPIRRTSIWERSISDMAQPTAPAAAQPGLRPSSRPAPQPDPQNVVPMPASAARFAEPAPFQSRFEAPRPAGTQPAPTRFIPSSQAPAPIPDPWPTGEAATVGEIAIHDRADADLRSVTVAPRSVSGFKLPPAPCSTPAKVRKRSAKKNSATKPASSSRNAPNSTSAARSCKSIPVPWSPPTSSSPRPA